MGDGLGVEQQSMQSGAYGYRYKLVLVYIVGVCFCGLVIADLLLNRLQRLLANLYSNDRRASALH